MKSPRLLQAPGVLLPVAAHFLAASRRISAFPWISARPGQLSWACATHGSLGNGPGTNESSVDGLDCIAPGSVGLSFTAVAPGWL